MYSRSQEYSGEYYHMCVYSYSLFFTYLVDSVLVEKHQPRPPPNICVQNNGRGPGGHKRIPVIGNVLWFS